MAKMTSDTARPALTANAPVGMSTVLAMERIAALMSVKSIVTIILTCVFAWQAITGSISQDFMTVYAVIIAFYYGTQSQKAQDLMDGESK